MLCLFVILVVSRFCFEGGTFVLIAPVSVIAYLLLNPSIPTQWLYNTFMLSIYVVGAPSSQLVECQALYHKIGGSNLTRGAVLCP